MVPGVYHVPGGIHDIMNKMRRKVARASVRRTSVLDHTAVPGYSVEYEEQ